MKFVFRIINESILQAFQQLTGNKLRSFLSLLGISIGIFCIIGVLSAVDSLEVNIKNSFEKLGRNVVYISKMPWKDFSEDDYFKYLRRPNPNYFDYRVIKEKSELSSAVSYALFLGRYPAYFRNNKIDNAGLFSVTHEYDEIFKLDFEKGRYFSVLESNNGTERCVIGNKIATELFGNLDPINREIEIAGKKFLVIGTLNKKGKDIMSFMDYDNIILVPFEFGRKVMNINSDNAHRGGMLAVKAKDDFSNVELMDELTGILRAHRKLKPVELDNFSLNESSLLTKLVEQFFNVLNLAGFVIGIFALLVGAVSVANIMFVSVKERTSIIGIKKALGARRLVILLEFLIESVILCIVGGILGLFLVYGILTLVSLLLNFDIFLSFKNVVFGIFGSIIIGVLSGIIPAIQASGLDPVEAMRK